MHNMHVTAQYYDYWKLDLSLFFDAKQEHEARHEAHNNLPPITKINDGSLD